MREGGKEEWKRAGVSKRDPAKAAREVGGNLDCRGTTPTRLDVPQKGGGLARRSGPGWIAENCPGDPGRGRPW